MPIDDGEYEPAASWPDETTEAITLLYRREGGAVYRTIYGIVLDSGEALDLTREAFLHALGAWDQCDRSDPRAWLHRIAADLAIARARKTHRRRPTPGDPVGAGQPEGQAQEPDLVVWLMQALTPEQRALVTLCYYQQMTPDQIARSFGIPSGSLVSRLNRSMQVMRRQAQAYGAMQPREQVAR